MFGKNYVAVQFNNLDFDESIYNVKVTKDNFNFSIVVKQAERSFWNGNRYIWFLHVELPKTNTFKLCAYSKRKFATIEKCQADAFKCLTELKKFISENV